MTDQLNELPYPPAPTYQRFPGANEMRIPPGNWEDQPPQYSSGIHHTQPPVPGRGATANRARHLFTIGLYPSRAANTVQPANRYDRMKEQHRRCLFLTSMSIILMATILVIAYTVGSSAVRERHCQYFSQRFSQEVGNLNTIPFANGSDAFSLPSYDGIDLQCGKYDGCDAEKWRPYVYEGAGENGEDVAVFGCKVFDGVWWCQPGKCDGFECRNFVGVCSVKSSLWREPWKDEHYGRCFGRFCQRH